MQTVTHSQPVDKLTAIKNWFLELFFPSFCLGCKREGTVLCQDCQATLEISSYRYCLCNKNPLRLPEESRQGKCSRCQNLKLSGLYFALPYQEKLLTRKIIYQFKYPPYLKILAKPLAEMIVSHFVLTNQDLKETFENAVLVPVPLEKSKLKHRGYNQSQLLASQLGQILNVPTDFTSLIKIKKTAPQMELNAKERAENLKGAFAIKNPAIIAGKKIFLVDDVYTTGATMAECTEVLKRAGAKQVFGIVIAREG